MGMCADSEIAMRNWDSVWYAVAGAILHSDTINIRPRISAVSSITRQVGVVGAIHGDAIADESIVAAP